MYGNKKFKVHNPINFSRRFFSEQQKDKRISRLSYIYASNIKSCAESTLTMRSREVSTWKLRPRGSGLNITVARAIYKD